MVSLMIEEVEISSDFSNTFGAMALSKGLTIDFS